MTDQDLIKAFLSSGGKVTRLAENASFIATEHVQEKREMLAQDFAFNGDYAAAQEALFGSFDNVKGR